MTTVNDGARRRPPAGPYGPAPTSVPQRPPGTLRSPRPTRPLRTWHLALVLIATHSPLTLLWATVPQGFGLSGVVSSPLVFGLGGLVLLAFVLGVSGLAKRIRHPGGLYVPVAHGLGRTIGLGVAVMMAVAYPVLLAALYGIFAEMLKLLVHNVLDVDCPVWLGIVLCAVVAGVAGSFPVRRIAPFLAVLIGAQLVAVLICVIAGFSHPAGGNASFESIAPGGLLTGSFGVALVWALIASAGMEAAPSYSEELADPQRSVTRATYLAYGVMMLVTIVSAVAFSVVAGPEDAPLLAGKAGFGSVLAVAAMVVSPGSLSLVTNLLLATLVVGLLGAAVTLQAGTGRQFTGLARDGGLLRRARPGRIPVPISVIQATLVAVIALVSLSSDIELVPVWLQLGAALAIIGAIMLASVASMAWFLRGEAGSSGFMGWEGYVIAAAIAAVTTGFTLVWGISHVVPIAPGAPEHAGWYAGLVVVLPFLVGILAARTVKVLRPDLYDRIGHSSAQGGTLVEPDVDEPTPARAGRPI